MITGTFIDFAAKLVTSGYKWLTSTLLTAQQQFAVRPYFSMKIIDDTIQPIAELFNGSGNPLANGQMATAPDGTVYAVGLDSNNHVAVWWDTNLNADAGVWANKAVIDTDSTVVNGQNQYSLSISGWVQGKYRVSVGYFNNFGTNGTDLNVVNQYSDNFGATWTKQDLAETGLVNTNYNSNPLNLSIAVGKPLYQPSSGFIQSVIFFIKPNSNVFASGFTGYDIYYDIASEGGMTSGTKWSQKNANSNDWTIHSLASYYINNTRYVAFAGFHNVLGSSQNENFSIWITGILNYTQTTSNDLWSQPVSAMPIPSATSINLNSFIFPAVTVANGMTYLTFQATTVDSVSSSATGTAATIVTTHTNYMMLQSDNGINFSYPSILVYSDGTEFNSNAPASFVPQGNYWYLGGANGYLWQFIQNNIVADISADVIGYSISETADQPSSINVQIGNQNGQWFGGASLNPGADAIAANRKIVLWQGYYNANGIPETVPRNIYYIDDIQQNVTGTENDLTLVGRDWYKNLKTTITKFSYQFVGTTLYSDVFDGTTLGNWNQVAGTWTEYGPPGEVPPLIEVNNQTGGDAALILSNAVAQSYGYSMSIFFKVSGTLSASHVYAVYIDANNWLRVEVENNPAANPAWYVKQNVAGTQTTLDSGIFPNPLDNTSKYYPIFIRCFDYYKFNFMTSEFSNSIGNDPQVYETSTTSFLLQNSTSGLFDLSSVFGNAPTWQVPFSVGFGTSKAGLTDFRYFQYASLTGPNTLSSVLTTIARLAHIFSFKFVNTFREYMYVNNFSGTFSIVNRILNVTAGNMAQSNINQLGDAELTFMGKIISTGNPSGFRFLFRTNSPTSPTAYYALHVMQASTGGYVGCRFERLFSSINYVFYNTAADVNNNPANIGSLNIDITQWHKYRIVMIGSWMYAFIDDVMIAAWDDDWNGGAGPSSGYWGFAADSNTTLQVQHVQAPQLWKPVQTFSINPGDDMESDADSLTGTLRAWYFSDLFGRFKALFLNPNDSSTYTYNLQLFQQNVDDSSKEYVSQVTVYGNGVSATARNTSLMVGQSTREEVIVDYTILTVTDAQTRANNELINANQYQSQYTPKQVMNVGAEMFDAVTIVNTGNNTSDVSGPTRTYAQTLNEGGGNNATDYSIELDTGNL